MIVSFRLNSDKQAQESHTSVSTPTLPHSDGQGSHLQGVKPFGMFRFSLHVLSGSCARLPCSSRSGRGRYDDSAVQTGPCEPLNLRGTPSFEPATGLQTWQVETEKSMQCEWIYREYMKMWKRGKKERKQKYNNSMKTRLTWSSITVCSYGQKTRHSAQLTGLTGPVLAPPDLGPACFSMEPYTGGTPTTDCGSVSVGATSGTAASTRSFTWRGLTSHPYDTRQVEVTSCHDRLEQAHGTPVTGVLVR